MLGKIVVVSFFLAVLVTFVAVIAIVAANAISPFV